MAYLYMLKQLWHYAREERWKIATYWDNTPKPIAVIQYLSVWHAVES